MRRFPGIGIAVGWMVAGVCMHGDGTMTNLYDFTMRDIDGKDVSLSAFKGKDIHPFYAFLTSKETNPNFGAAISWIFNKFLVGQEWAILGRFGSRTPPDDKGGFC